MTWAKYRLVAQFAANSQFLKTPIKDVKNVMWLDLIDEDNEGFQHAMQRLGEVKKIRDEYLAKQANQQ